MSWRTYPLAGFDLETTGIDTETCRIVTACLGTVYPGEQWRATNWLLKQTQPIPAEATAVHGITTEHANEHGMDATVALQEIRLAIYGAWESGMVVCGYNIGGYDFALLDRELRRHGLGHLEIKGPILDGFVIDKHISHRKGSRKLIDTCAHYGIQLDEDDAHGAEADALAATRLAWVLATHPAVPQDMPELNLWQSIQYQRQRESLAVHFRRSGNTKAADDVAARTTWPIQPIAEQAAA